MGGLVSRLVLETGAYDDRPWFNKVKMFIALATPHQGAPLALARVLGLDSTLGITKSDFRKLASDPSYPSAYQLLPAPNEAACWSKTDLSVGTIDIYDEATATRLGLNPQLLKRARFVHDSLARGKVPSHVRYFYFAGTGHETVTRVNVQEVAGTYPSEEMVLTRSEDAGDGTVPFWSALPRPVQKQVVVNEHAQVFRGMAFKRVFYRLLGGDLGVPLQSLGREEEEVLALQLSLPTPVIHAGHEFELLVVPTVQVGSIAGTFVLQRLKEDGTAAGSFEELSKITYAGPPVSRLRLSMPPIINPGLYELRFTGNPANSDPLKFAVASIAE